MGVTYRHVDLDENGVSIHELEEKKIDIIHTSPSHNFPTGIVMPVSRRYELLGWAAKKKQHYITDAHRGCKCFCKGVVAHLLSRWLGRKNT